MKFVSVTTYLLNLNKCVIAKLLHYIHHFLARCLIRVCELDTALCELSALCYRKFYWRINFFFISSFKMCSIVHLFHAKYVIT